MQETVKDCRRDDLVLAAGRAATDASASLPPTSRDEHFRPALSAAVSTDAHRYRPAGSPPLHAEWRLHRRPRA